MTVAQAVNPIIKFRKVLTPDLSEKVVQLAHNLSISPLLAKVLVVRGIDEEARVNAFLAPSLAEHLPDPKNLAGLTQAAEFLVDAIRNKLYITIFTDFDVDGLTAGSQLLIYLKALGAVVDHYTPNRFTEGYGLTDASLSKLIKAGTQVLVTVDCGISSHSQIQQAKDAGMKVLVLDHHYAENSPPADVVVDPALNMDQQEIYNCCAAGLVWMLLIELRRVFRGHLKNSENVTLPDPKDFLDLAAVGTICDMVPLVGLNRVIVHRGIIALRQTERVGLKALQEVAGVTNTNRLSSGHVAFGIGPRINAAGRLEDTKEVFELLITSSRQKAQTIAERLNKINAERKAVEESVRKECSAMIVKNQLEQAPALALYRPDFHTGVIGIVAQRLVEEFNRPAAVMGDGESFDYKGNSRRIVKGSVRSIEGFHVAEVLEKLSKYLISYGGHAQAGGFSLESAVVPEFAQEFSAMAGELLDLESYRPKIAVDVELSFDEVSFESIEELSLLAPFGVGNPSPMFLTKEVQVVSVQSIGSNHLRLKVASSGKTLTAVAWRMQGHPYLRKGKKVTLVYQPEINSYQGVSSVQLNIKEAWSE